ncbi:MAG: hypothetical protein ABGY24_10710 [bacterium]
MGCHPDYDPANIAADMFEPDDQRDIKPGTGLWPHVLAPPMPVPSGGLPPSPAVFWMVPMS